MIIGSRRIILIGAIGAVALAIILYPLIVSAGCPDASKVIIKLAKVEVADSGAGKQSTRLNLAFNFTNPLDQTLTTSKIQYDLFADGILLGDSIISYEDIPVNGRPQMFSDTSVPIRGDFELQSSDKLADIYNKITGSISGIKWTARGNAQLESAICQGQTEFSTDLQT